MPRKRIGQKSIKRLVPGWDKKSEADYSALRISAGKLRRASASGGGRLYGCPVCGEESCGDDFHTMTQYAGPELAVGDRMKVILLQIYDLCAIDNLQLAEIKALIGCLADEHIVETDLEKKPAKAKKT
jgi:hypothetical protein